MRINAFLSQAGIASRRAADALIAQGKVRVNKKIMKTLGTKIDPAKDLVEYIKSGTNPNQATFTWTPVALSATKTTYLLFKPRGYVCSMVKQGRDPIVQRLVPPTPRVFPVGRLDKESEGLLLMTNDGELSLSLTHPSQHISKTYSVIGQIPQSMTQAEVRRVIARLEKGIKIDQRTTKKCNIHIIEDNTNWEKGRVAFSMELFEGRNRQIRRMLGAFNIEVKKLVRTAIGAISLEKYDVKPGKYIKIDKPERILFPKTKS